MQKYNFDITPDLRGTGSRRWIQPEECTETRAVIGMGTADLDFKCPPCISSALQRTAEEEIYNYRMTPESYYNGIRDYYSRRYGMNVSKDWIVGLPGTLPTIRLLLTAFASEGDGIIMQSPYFNPLRTVIEGSGCRLIENPMKLTEGRYELDFEDFERKLKEENPSIFILVNPQNPSGRVFSKEKLRKLTDLCEKYDVLILSDEVHSLITYDNHQHIPILAVSENARRRSILVFSLSKGFNIMGLTHAITLIADPDLRRKWKEFLRPFDFDYVMNAFSVAGVTAALSREAEVWLAELTEYLKGNRDLLMRELAESLFPMKPVCPEAGFLMWTDCRGMGIDAADMERFFLEQAGISLDNGANFGIQGDGFVRINFAVSRSTLKEAVRRLKEM